MDAQDWLAVAIMVALLGTFAALASWLERRYGK